MRRRAAWALGLSLCLCAETALALGPRETELVARADHLLARGRPQRALVLLERAHARAASDAALTLKIVGLLLPDPNPPKALSATGKAEDLARALRMLDDLSMSGAVLDAAQQRKATQLRAWALTQQGMFSQAIRLFAERGSAGDRETVRWLESVAALAIRREDLSAADEALRTARRFLPDDAELMADLASVWLAQGRAEASLPLWEARFHRDPSSLDARRDLAAAWLATGRAREAFTLLEEAREACNAAPNCALEAARAALELGDAQAALQRLSGQFAGSQLEALFLRGDAHTRLGDRAGAQKAYEDILKLKPGHVRALENLRAVSLPTQETPTN